VTETVKEPFCPLYHKVVADEPWKNAFKPNRGLLFDKFASAWRYHDGKPEFDEGDKRKHEQADHEKRGHWLREMAKDVGANQHLTEVSQRQQSLVNAMGGKILLWKNTSRFVTGLGREHPLENGFAWHHTLGVPYLPGSSLKGVLRAWYRENGPWDEVKQRWQENSTIRTLFGSHEKDENGHEYGVGRFVLLDMIPSEQPKLAVDIMTPHYGRYYQDARSPQAIGTALYQLAFWLSRPELPGSSPSCPGLRTERSPRTILRT